MATLTLQAAEKDTILWQGAPDNNYGSATGPAVQSRNANRNQRYILEFSISSLPGGANIRSATLSLYDWANNNSQGRTYWAYKLIRTDWVEMEATWNIYKTSNNWTLAGGDYVTSSPVGGSDTVPAINNWMDFDVLAIVQDAYDGLIAAEFLVKDGTESADSTSRYTIFRSAEYGTESVRPKLVIVYNEDAPTVTIQAITNIVTTTARGHGEVTDLGDASVTEHGHCWDLEANPTPDTGDSKTTLGAKAAIGTFVSEITGLTEGQTYAVRDYATNSYGTSYSSELTFVAGTAGATSLPTQAITRVTNLIHRYNRKEGVYTLELSLGEVTSDFGLPQWLSKPQASTPEKAAQQQQEEVAKSPAVKASIQEAIDEVITTAPVVPTEPTEPARLTPYAEEILKTPAAEAFEARRKGLELGVKGIITTYAIDVLRKKEQEAKTLIELQRVQKAASATGITSYARQVLIKKSIELKQQLEALYGSR